MNDVPEKPVIKLLTMKTQVHYLPTPFRFYKLIDEGNTIGSPRIVGKV